MDIPFETLGLIPLATEYGIKIIGALLLFIITFKLAGFAQRIAVRAFEKAKIEKTLVSFGGTLVKWSVLCIASVSILGLFGIETASFAAVIAAMGLAIGLAFQGTLANFAAGVMLLVFRPFKVGQFVKVGSQSGTVNSISIFYSALDTPDNRRIIIPNSKVFGEIIENNSFHDRRRVDISIGTAYDADLDTTKKILLEAAKSITQVLPEPQPAVILAELGASSVDWSIRVYTESANYWAVREQLLWRAKNSLDKAGVGIPFPQLEIHQQQLQTTKAASTTAG